MKKNQFHRKTVKELRQIEKELARTKESFEARLEVELLLNNAYTYPEVIGIPTTHNQTKKESFRKGLITSISSTVRGITYYSDVESFTARELFSYLGWEKYITFNMFVSLMGGVVARGVLKREGNVYSMVKPRKSFLLQKLK